MKRIAIVGMTSNKGGIESIIMNIYRNIDRSKIQFDFILQHSMGTMAYEYEAIEMGANIYRVLHPRRNGFLKSKRVLHRFFQEHPEIDGVYQHVNYPYIFPF